MSGYTLNGSPWGGSFILEGSTDGTNWDVMVAKTGNNTFLGREGLSTTGGNISSGYNSTALSNTAFSIYKPDNTYFPPDTVSTATYSGDLKQYSTTTGCKVTLSRGDSTWNKTSNTKEDFNVNCFLSTESPWTAGTKFNCVVTDYNSANGDLTFDATPTISGTCKFAIIVRSGQGTGVISSTLTTNTVDVKIFISPLWTAARYNNNSLSSSSVTNSNSSSSRTPTTETLSNHLYGAAQTFPGNFPSLAYCDIPSGYTRPASFIAYGDWVATTGTVAFSNGGYTNTGEVTSVFIDWLKSTFDVNMFKLSSGTIWNGSNHTSISDIQFRWNNMIQHHNGGAFFSLMYPKLDKMISMRSGGVGPILNIDSSWYYNWGYQRPQKATRIFIARDFPEPFELSSTASTYTFSVPCGNHKSGFSPGPDPYTGNQVNGSALYGVYQYRGTSTLSDIVVGVCNVIDYNTGNSVDGWVEVARVNVSIWLRNTNGAWWDTMNDVGNTGGGIWVPFNTSIVQANPNGWKYYRISSNGSGDTRLTTNWTWSGDIVHTYTTHWYNASTMGSLVTILGGVEDTALRYNTVNW